MICDFHAHVGNFRAGPGDPPGLTWDGLIELMDATDVDRAVHLPVYNGSPEGMPLGMIWGDGCSLHDQVVDAARYRDRIVPFANIDPRWGRNSPATDFGPLLDWFQEHGCRGVGEVTANLPFDDPRTTNVLRQLGERGLYLTMESAGMGPGAYGLQDEPGLPRLDRALSEAPKTIVIGHGPMFWAGIATNEPDDHALYPSGRVLGEGPLHRLFRRHENLYADLSAKSCFNALTRDPEFGAAFLEEFRERLLFGTDLVSSDAASRAAQRPVIDELIAGIMAGGRRDADVFGRVAWHRGLMPQLDYLRALRDSGAISQAAFDAITWNNAARLLGDDLAG